MSPRRGFGKFGTVIATKIPLLTELGVGSGIFAGILG
jgi:hypothetical protein